MEYRILGPLEVREGDCGLSVAGPKQRALLALLLVHANETVTAERLAMGLWGEDAAADAAKTVQVHVSRLRRALGGGQALVTTGAGYRLQVERGGLDAERFGQLADRGSSLLAAGDADGAAALLRDALALWRGPALADVAHAPFAASHAARLEEQRLAALEARVEADLERGRHAELVGELQQLTAAHPVREQLHGQLMLALYRSGRQADALDAFRHAREHLAEELGLEPSAALRSLQAEILEQSPALEPAPAAPSRLPSRDELLGRDDDVAAVIDLLQRDGAQLVTLIGIGGVGKTSLAIEVAHRMAARVPGGAAFVDLAPLTDAAEVPAAALRALGAAVQPGDTAVDALTRLVAARPRLLVFDNFEHVADAAPLLAALLRAAPAVKLLVTSRAALDLSREQRYALDPLGLPVSDEPADVAAAPASALFRARATARDPTLRLTADAAAAIADLCRRLDALPLAIELAAARAGVLSPQEIAGRLDSAIVDLGQGPRDAPSRQRTMRATLDWSYALLDDDERAAFARLSVFAGGCDPDAAERVADVPVALIDRLVAKSVLTRRLGPDGRTRVSLLEPVREYAAERLAERPDRTDVEHRHGRHYLELAETAHPHLLSAGQVAWGRRLDAEAANLRLALARARADGDAELVLRVIGALDEWWFSRGLWSEGRAWAHWALEHADDDVPAGIRAAGWQALGYLLWPENDREAVLAAADRAWELAVAADDREGMAWAKILLAQTYFSVQQDAAAQAAAAESVRVAEDVDDLAYGNALGVLAVTTDDWPEVRRIADRAAAALERAGDLLGLARLWESVAYEALAEGSIGEAGELLERTLELGQWIDGPGDAAGRLMLYGVVAVELGDDDDARRRLREALAVYRERGIKAYLAPGLLGLAVLAARDGDAARSGRLVGAARTALGGVDPDPVEQRLEATAREIATSTCPTDEWEQAVAAGAALDWNASLALALEGGAYGRTALGSRSSVS